MATETIPELVFWLSVIGMWTVATAVGIVVVALLERLITHSKQAETMLPKVFHNIR